MGHSELPIPQSPHRVVLQPSQRLLLASLLLVLSFSSVEGGSASIRDPAEPPLYRIPRLDADVTIDGVLDEPVWQDALVFDIPWETQPGENVPATVDTECRLFYTTTHLYYGCHAYDPEPETIRARYRDRDTSSFSDDTVGISLDPFDAQNRSYVLDVNPLGAQNDRLYTEATSQSDETWDAIWTSKGRLVDDGFVVEVEIPFVSLRFPRSLEEQVWGFNFRRYRPRDVRYRFAIVPYDRSNSCRLCQSAELVGFQGINPGKNLEINPTLTGIQSSTLDDQDQLMTEDPSVEPGLNVRWGFTPNLSLNAALNPDFSQIEADDAQLDINRQFALFFPERRPFFLEGRDYFATPIQAVYTRSVADPAWAAKVSGKEGKNALGAFGAQDEQTNLLLPGPQGSEVTELTEDSLDAVLRYRRDVAQSSTAGILYTDRSAGDYLNRVAGVDTQLRLTSTDQLSVQLLGSQTRYTQEIIDEFEQPEGQIGGYAAEGNYRHNTRDWVLEAGYKDISDDFRADLGFVPQVGFREWEVEGGYRWYGDADHWFTNLATELSLERSTDQKGGLLEEEIQLSGTYQGPFQSRIETGATLGNQVYEGQEFPRNRVRLELGIQPTSSVGFGGFGSVGKSIDFANVRPGDSLQGGPWIQLQLGRHLDFQAWHNYSQLDVQGGILFRAGQSESRLLYQLNTRTLFRAIVQYTTIDRNPDLYLDEVNKTERDLFTQLLFSYRLNASSAVYVGYSGAWSDVDQTGRMETGNTLFAKLSYNWRP